LVKPPDILSRYHIASSSPLFVTITKNPYSWLLSLYDRPYHQHYKKKPSFEDFLTTKWVTVMRENGPKTFSSPVALWNIKNASYLTLRNNFKVINLKYENLLADPKKTIDLIRSQLNLQTINNTFVNLELSTKENSKNHDYYKKYYLDEIWKGKLNPKIIDIINNKLDYQVMKSYGYNKL
jgi:hypothetical protein